MILLLILNPIELSAQQKAIFYLIFFLALEIYLVYNLITGAGPKVTYKDIAKIALAAVIFQLIMFSGYAIIGVE